MMAERNKYLYDLATALEITRIAHMETRALLIRSLPDYLAKVFDSVLELENDIDDAGGITTKRIAKRCGLTQVAAATILKELYALTLLERIEVTDSDGKYYCYRERRE
jgi:hypothetical protein